MNILTISHLYKTHSGQPQPAVKNATLVLKKGEILGLIGESGSGKTSLLHLVAGLADADSGTIRLKKEYVTGPSQNLVPGHPQIRLVHQDFQLAPAISVRDNIAYSLRAYQPEYKADRLDKMIRLCGLETLQHKQPRQLSGGEMQRVALARALADEPLLLLLDEPFSNVDTVRRQELKHEIGDIIRRSGTTAIFVTHDTAEALALSDRIAVMYQGVIVQTGTPQHVYQHPATPYVAGFFGYATIILAETLAKHWNQTKLAFPFGSSDTLCIRAEHMQLCPEREAEFTGTLRRIQYLGWYELWEVQMGEASIFQLVLCGKKEKATVGEIVFLKVDWAAVHVLDT